MVVCVGNVITSSKSNKDTENLLHSLKNGTDMVTKKERLELKKFDFRDDGNVKTFLGVSVDRTSSGFYLSQPHLIPRVLEAFGLTVEENSRRNTKDTPKTKPLLIKDTNGEPRFLLWDYRSVIEMMNSISGSNRPNIAMAVHQTDHFCINPRRSHDKVVMCIVIFLRCTAKIGMCHKIDMSRGV